MTIIKENTFNGCSSLVNVTIPPNLVSIEAYAFRCCESLKQIKISSNTKINKDAFSDCPSLEITFL